MDGFDRAQLAYDNELPAELDPLDPEWFQDPDDYRDMRGDR